MSFSVKLLEDEVAGVRLEAAVCVGMKRKRETKRKRQRRRKRNITYGSTYDRVHTGANTTGETNAR